MATVTLGNYYRFKDYNNNKYLNLFATGNPANNTNVTIHTLDSSDMGQVWKCDSHSYSTVNGVLMKCAKDTTFALDRWRGSSNYNNADVYTIGTTVADLQDQLVEFILLTNGYYRIKLAYADLYLTVSTTVTSGGYNVNWQAITGNEDQLWAAELYGTSTATPDSTPSEIKDQEFFVKAYGTDLNLNVYGTDTVANARNVNVYAKENCLAQKWIAKQTTAGPKLFTSINEAYALNINTSDNNCTMYTASGNDDDSVLEFEEVADMLYRIKMFKHGKYLTIDGTAASGSNVVWSDTASTATLWEFIPEATMFPPVPSSPDAPSAIVGNTYAVQANGTDFYLNVYGTDTVADGRNVNIYSKEDCQAQRWFIINTDNGPKLFTRINESYALNIDTSDDNCTMYPAEDNDADSLLEFESVGDMLYRIKMFNHDKYLCIDGTAASGTNVKWIAGASSATVWKLIPEATAFPVPSAAPTDLVGKTFFIKNYNTGYNLNVHGTNTVALGRNVNVYAKENADAQKWKVVQTAKGPKIVTEINETFALNIHVENNNNCVMYDIDDNNVDSIIELESYDTTKNIYKIKMFHHDKYLDAAGVGSGYNAHWVDSPSYPLWQFVEEDDMFPVASAASSDIVNKTYYIQNVNTGHYLNVNGADTVANTRNVNVYAKEDCQAQRWVIRNKNGGPKLVTKINEAFAINIYANDNNCTMYAEEGNDIDSVLQFIPYTTGRTTAEDGVYRIKMHYHNRYLTVANTNIGANAYWTSVDTEPYALWRLIPESEMTFEDTVDPDTTPDSPLVTKFRAAPSGNYLVGRDGCTISEITIHHVGAVGATIDSVYDSWINSGETTSSHYCVYGTQVGQYVKERNTAYTNGGALLNPDDIHYNHRAVTIETCNSTGAPNWEVSDDTYYTLVRLVADIAKRNNLGTLVVGQNLTYHSFYSSTECPGPYLLARMQDIADRANEINSSAVFIRKLGTQYPLVLTSTASDEGYGVTFSETVSESNQKWVIKDTAEGKEIINAFDTTQNLRLNSTNDAFIISSDENLSKAYLIPSEDNAEKFSIRAAINTVLRTVTYVWLGVSIAGTSVVDAENKGEFVDTSTNADAPTAQLVPADVPDELDDWRFKIKNGEYYITVTGQDISLSSKTTDPNQVFEIENSYMGPNIKSLSGTNSYLSINPLNNEPFSILPMVIDRNVSLNIKFEPLNQTTHPNQYYIHSLRYDKYLGIDKSNPLLVTGELMWGKFTLDIYENFIWTLEEPEPKPINDWLIAYYNPQDKANARDVEIPDYAYIKKKTDEQTYEQTYGKNEGLKEIEDNEILNVISFGENESNSDYIKVVSFDNVAYGSTNEIPYSFTNKFNWFTGQATTTAFPYINVNAYNQIMTLDDEKETVEFKFFNDVCVDENDMYWIAVGPNVVNPLHKSYETPADSEMYGKGTLDIVLKRDDIVYYVRCRVGGTKAHTWNNGVIQTWFEYPDACDFVTYATSYYNGTVCAEFMARNGLDLDINYSECLNTLGQYEVEKIIFYDKEKLE